MAVTNFLVSSLPAYVQENRDLLIKNFALVGTATRQRIGLQTGIKKSAYLNYLALAATLQDGSGCGHNPLDELTLSQRTIDVAAIKVDGQICPETLLGKYAEYLVRVSATENDLPFEQYIVDTLVAEINKKIEKLIWQGDVSATTNPDLKWFDGFLEQMSDDADTIDVAIASGKSAYEGILEVYMAMPEEVLEKGGVIFVSPAIYRCFLQDMVAINFYHYAGPQDSAPEEFIVPGTDVKVVKTPGLAGSLDIVGTFADNLVYGTDAENDNEAIDIWWSQDDRLFKYQVKWNSGVAYHFPAMNVLGVFAAAPTRPAPVADYSQALGTIATNTANIKDYSTVLGGIKNGTDNIKDNSTAIGNIATAAGKLADTVNADNQLETHPNTGE